MKFVLSLILFILFAIFVVFGGEYLYDLKNTNTQTNEIAETNKAVNTELKSNLKQVNTSSNQNSNKTLLKSTVLSSNVETSPHFLAGFDWSLPSKTKMTEYSGLISGEGNNPNHDINNFQIVLWNKTNPAKGQYDFSRLEAALKRIAPKKVLVRLEVNSSCEAPKWALKQLRETKHKSLIFWDKSYMDLTRPYINAFAKRFAAHPQIIGVQLGLADGEFGQAGDSCKDYDNKNGWGEFWMSPSERQEAESQFGFNPDVFTQASMDNIDIYANAFGAHKNKLAFTNIGTLYTYGEGSEPYNQKLKTIAKYALDNGIGNRDGAIERWLSFTDKVYGSVFTAMPDGSCRLDVNELYMRKLQGRYWGTENEFYGNKGYVINVMGPLKNHPYQFMISSLRALQMRRNFMSITDMQKIDHVDYKTQEFINYLTLTMGKNLENTPDAFVLMGERYIAPYRLADQMDASCVKSQTDKVTVRSFGRWLTESPQNAQIENAPAIKIHMPKSEKNWYQGYYLPNGIDYEYFARSAKQFSFDLNDQLSQTRCKNGCEVEVKATFKDTVKTKLHLQVLEGVSPEIQTLGDNKVKTVSFKINSKFNQNTIQNTSQNTILNKEQSDLTLISDNEAIPLILMRINFLN